MDLSTAARLKVPSAWVLTSWRPTGHPDSLEYTVFEAVLKRKDDDSIGVLYHLVVKFNKKVPDAAENELMATIKDAMDLDAGEWNLDKMDLSGQTCLDFCFTNSHLWTSVESDLLPVPAAWEETFPKARNGSNPPLRPVVRRILRTTTSGALEAAPHTWQLPVRGFQTGPFPHPCPRDVPVVLPSQLKQLLKVDTRCYRVSVTGDSRTIGDRFGGVFVQKTLRPGGPSQCLSRELETLASLDHPGVVKLAAAVVAAEDPAGPVASLLLANVPGTILAAVPAATAEQKRAWTAQLRDALAHIHGRGRVWGDAKPHNIIVHNASDALVLIDFEGGYTSPWVHWRNAGTKAGDTEGAAAIEHFIAALPTPADA
eukprot:TRINITY_DN1611_c0_g1_i2.p1 TRINITY_DN1611_c0_g1~~TRINITY_DN1611_c0_g1_i2.p1  ORF type:complete len:370 (-),score=87.13 TRINITY_DN1611_c0_g1_i2:368-1477(-)